jgi:predicted trehalose synthase
MSVSLDYAPLISYDLSTVNSSYEKKMGRIRRWHEDMVARFVEGTIAAIDAVLKENETRTDFIREAVARELRRRSR